MDLKGKDSLPPATAGGLGFGSLGARLDPAKRVMSPQN